MSIRARMIIIALLLLPSIAFAQIDWNDKVVKWHGYDAGVAAAKRENKGILLIVYADWCGVCKEYSEMFSDREVIKNSRNVVLIRLNQDTDKAHLSKYSLDGQYVPRTYILNKKQAIQPSPYKSKKYAFYLGSDDTAMLIKVMREMKP